MSLQSLGKHVRLYFWFLRANWLSLMAYPAAFIADNVSCVIYALGSVASVWVIFTQIRAIGEWTFPQVLLIYGLSILSRSLFHLFWVNFMSVGTMVRNGEIDRLLVRPLDTMYQVFAGYLDNDDWGEFAVALYLVWTSLGMLGMRTLGMVAWMLLAGVAGSVINASIHVVMNATAFFVVENRGFSSLAWAMDTFSRYPLDIYKKPLRYFLTWLIPIGFTSFYPAQLAFGKGHLVAAARMTPLVAAACLFLAYKFWTMAVDKYQGVGN